MFGVKSAEDEEVSILTVEEADRLLRTAIETNSHKYGQITYGIAPVVALGFFCGLRSEEIQRLQWSSVDLGKRMIRIGPEVAKKRFQRFVDIPENAAEWLTLLKQDGGPVIGSEYDGDYDKRFGKLCASAGFVTRSPSGRRTSTWKTNAMRHSFATYRFEQTGDAEYVAKQIGHRQIDRQTPSGMNLHLIVDNCATHKHPAVKQWIVKHPRFHLHFTPTSSSWLNLVERWFAEITRERIRRGSFHSVANLIEAIESYIQHNNSTPKPFHWTKRVDQILEKVGRCKDATVTRH